MLIQRGANLKALQYLHGIIVYICVCTYFSVYVHVEGRVYMKHDIVYGQKIVLREPVLHHIANPECILM